MDVSRYKFLNAEIRIAQGVYIVFVWAVSFCDLRLGGLSACKIFLVYGCVKVQILKCIFFVQGLKVVGGAGRAKNVQTPWIDVATWKNRSTPINKQG